MEESEFPNWHVTWKQQTEEALRLHWMIISSDAENNNLIDLKFVVKKLEKIDSER